MLKIVSHSIIFVIGEKISGDAFLMLKQEQLKYLIKPMGTFMKLQALQTELKESKVSI